MIAENNSGKNTGKPESEYVLDLISGAFPGGSGEYHKLYLFNDLVRGDSNWRFLIVTRVAGDGRIELEAFSYAIDDQGNLTRKLESRKARIPPEKLGEVIDSLILRWDEPECDYRTVNLSGFQEAESKLEFLRQALGEVKDDSIIKQRAENDVQSGESDQV